MKLQEKFQALFEALPDTLSPSMTFMEIAGYPHYENVCSNILKFYLNPKAKHNCFDDLVLLSLLSTVEKAETSFAQSAGLKIRREVVTTNGRIDLVLYTDNWVIGIENKIWHTLQNDLDEYNLFLKQNFPNRQPLNIVLSIRPEHNLKGEFINVLYKDFIKKIESSIATYNFDVNDPYYIFFIHFIQTIKNQFININMEKDEIMFIVNNQENINNLIELDRKLDKYIANRAYVIKEAIQVESSVDTWVYKNYDVGFTFIEGGSKYKLECEINRSEIVIKLCIENRQATREELIKLDYFKDKDLVEFTPDENGKWILKTIDFFVDDQELIKELQVFLSGFKISQATNDHLNFVVNEQLN